MLAVGIIGLPNVGKSTLFNALTSGEAAVSNYPFTTIDSNVGVVAVPDHRLLRLRSLLHPQETQPCTIQFTDIAGLVRGASTGEGLGNQFLAAIREVDAILHLVRCFEEGDVVHVEGDVDPVRDVQVIETELLLADLEIMEKAIEKRVRNWKTSPREFAAEKERFEEYLETLRRGIPLRALPIAKLHKQELKGLGMLTGKPLLIAANLSESDFEQQNMSRMEVLKDLSGLGPYRLTALSATLEFELHRLTPEERREFLESMGRLRSGLDCLISAAFRLLSLITFYTNVNQKLRAWEISEGTTAPQAAGKIHSDMEKGFIRAEVVTFDDMDLYGSFQQLQRLGKIRTEGRNYIVQDGDVIEFHFSG